MTNPDDMKARLRKSPGADIGAENRRCVLDWWFSHPWGTKRECAKDLGLSAEAVGRHAATLRKQWEGRAVTEMPVVITPDGLAIDGDRTRLAQSIPKADHIATLEAEVERLREALRQIADDRYNFNSIEPLIEQLHSWQQIARAALKDTDHG